MGIHWLNYFIEHISSYQWIECQPKGIVIDGLSFIYTFSELRAAPWIEGGRYGVLRDMLMEFFTYLKSTSGIDLLVVMEGFDHNRKEKECVRIKRRKGRNQGIARSLLENQRTNSLFPVPVLSFKVFLMTMKELGIPVLYAHGDADQGTVAIANYYNYPVLANDSDYYMYDIKAGYIPIYNLDLHARPLKLEVYKLCKFNRQFGLVDPQLSRVIPAVLGNDLITTDLMDQLIKEGVISTDNYRQVGSLIRFISKVSNVEQLILHIRETMDRGVEIAEVLRANIKQAQEMYDGIDPLSKEELQAKSLVIPDSGNRVEIPSWLMKYGRGLVSLAIEGKSLPGCVIDNPHKPTARLASVGIRQSMYTMMSPLMKENRVIEIMRNDLRKGGKSEDIKMVNHEVTLFPPHTLPSVLDIEGMSHDEKLSVFCRVLGIDRNILDWFDNQWKLVIAAACYWVKECRPNTKLIEALAATFVHCFEQRVVSRHANDPGVERLLSSLEDSNIKHDERNQWLDALHSFACFQCIFIDTVTLNDLLQSCLDATLSPAFFFDGKVALTYVCTDALQSIFDEKIIPNPLYRKIFETLMALL